MGFDAVVCFTNIPSKFEACWHAAFRELGVDKRVFIPDDWENGGLWCLLDGPNGLSDDGFIIKVGRVDQNAIERDYAADEKTMLSTERYHANISTRRCTGNRALMMAGSVAKVTGGVMFDPQVARFVPVFDSISLSILL